MLIKYKKLSSHAITPLRATPLSAGYDLFSAYDCVVPSKGKQLIKTDIAIEIPSNSYGRIAPRSGLAWKHFIDVGAGIIDSDYRGNLQVLLYNFSDQDYQVKQGDRIAQLLIQPIQHFNFIEDNLTANIRGGFGSTGY